MDQIEARHPVTSLDTVSCRTDLLDWYERRGYRRVSEIPIDQVSLEKDCLHDKQLSKYFSVIGTEKKI